MGQFLSPRELPSTHLHGGVLRPHPPDTGTSRPSGHTLRYMEVCHWHDVQSDCGHPRYRRVPFHLTQMACAITHLLLSAPVGRESFLFCVDQVLPNVEPSDYETCFLS